MVDEDPARSLEQEAIALVSLSTSTAKPQDVSHPLELYVQASTTVPDTTTKADLPPTEPVDGNISMKSLLVTLKKRKLQHSESKSSDDQEDDTKLPSFRDVFQPQPKADPTDDENETTTNPELKCKYRTGKCHNVRALKSCGDYHNLCNYHRLRANANQRKLDRKKKEQRLQQQQMALSSAMTPRTASSHAAAAALASLVAAQPQHQFDMVQQRQLFPMQDAAGKTRRNRSTTDTCVRPKQEDACSY